MNLLGRAAGDRIQYIKDQFDENLILDYRQFVETKVFKVLQTKLDDSERKSTFLRNEYNKLKE